MSTIIITGANRGLGIEFTKSFASKGYRVIAFVRDPSKMPKVEGVLAIKYDASSSSSASEAIRELKEAHGVSMVDIVLANAGVLPSAALIRDITPEEFELCWRVNFLAPAMLFQAARPILKANGKYIVMSTEMATLDQDLSSGMGSYSTSKTAVNALIRKLHFEEPDYSIFSLSPGWVDTEMGSTGASWSGLTKTPQRVSDTLPGMVKVIEDGHKDNYSGYMIN
ncbi:hypothetical protein P7C73_g3161, partial [Tremellales sp. Uapishka_1]